MEAISFVQLSDLHIGRRLFDNRLVRIPFIEGFNPHDDNLFEPLRLRVEQIEFSDEYGVNNPLHYLITGDLTAGGTRNDFALAYSLLRERRVHTPGILPDKVGFAFDPNRTIIIPGNHDHWNSDFEPSSYNASLSRHYVRPTPWRDPLWSAGGKLMLEFFAVDSNSGMPERSRLRKGMAGGDISRGQFEILEDKLQLSRTESARDGALGIKRVRALLCHHAFEGVSSRTPFPLSTRSREQLENLCKTYDVPVVLTGHMHERVNFNRWPKEGEWLQELSAATPTAGPAQIGKSGFQLHRLTWEAPACDVTWSCLPFELETPEQGGFLFAPQPFMEKKLTL